MLELSRRQSTTPRGVKIASRDLANACKIARSKTVPAIDSLTRRGLITTRQGTARSPPLIHVAALARAKSDEMIMVTQTETETLHALLAREATPTESQAQALRTLASLRSGVRGQGPRLKSLNGMRTRSPFSYTRRKP